ncbi:hypothetical protein Tco_0617878 [Tanacetum coccineum]
MNETPRACMNGFNESIDSIKLSLMISEYEYDSCVNTQDYSCCLNGKVKEVGVLENLKVALGNEGFTDIDLRYMGGLWVMIAFDSVEAKEKFLLSTRVRTHWVRDIRGFRVATPDLDDQNDEE